MRATGFLRAQPALIAQAAALIAGIAPAHAYSDGNKRLALVAGATFLRLNGVAIQAEPPVFAQQIEAVETRTDSLDAATERLITWLREHSRPA
jgi:prophage maintenance system killer protein